MMFSGIFTMMFIVIVVSVILGITRSGRPPLGGGPTGYGQLPPQQPPQLTQWGGFGNQLGYGAPVGYGAQPAQGYDPAAYQPMTPQVRDAVDRDITSYGEQLRDLDLDVVGRELDATAQADYSSALDAYDGAKQQLQHATTNADVKHIAEILEKGRYEIACVKARVNGHPVPARRVPCFFDPAHGVSVEDVSWAPPGGSVRQVPACAADVQRIRTGNDPSIRMVYAAPQQQMVPYWEDRSYAPWAQGYYGRYGTDPALRSLTHGALMIGGFSLLMGLLDD